MAQNSAFIPDLPEAVSKPPAGIVLPPKDIRAIVEKTAGYVARNGPVFEDRIRDKEQHNPKFSFLSPNDAYAPFYLWRLDEVRSGRGTNISAGRTDGATATVEEKSKGPPQPPDFQFSARMPNISAQDLEIVKLTALHVARKGKSWMTALSQREARNYQFDFLRPQHSLYNFFSRLVDQYTLLLQTGPEGQKAEQARISVLQANLAKRFRVLEVARKRADYLKWVAAQRQQKEEEEQAEQMAYAQIDWHDFVVVETVLFTDADEAADLPPPTSLNDLQSASLEQKAMMSLTRPDMRIEEAMPTDDMSSYAYGGYTDGYAQPQEAVSYTPQPRQSFPTAMDYTATQPLANLAPPSLPAQTPTYSPSPQPQVPPQPTPPPSDLPPRPDSLPQGQPPPTTQTQPMKIRSDYIPRAQARAQKQNTVLCPNCHQQIPLSEYDTHARIELLDPQWKEQRAKADSRFASTNLGGTDVAANLKRLRARTGGDTSDAAMSADNAMVVAEEEERRKRVRTEEMQQGAVAYGGMPTVDAQRPAPQAQQGKDMNVQEQIRHLHQKYKS